MKYNKRYLNILAALVFITSFCTFGSRVYAQTDGEQQAAWQTTQSLPETTEGESTLAVNGFLYVLGGSTQTGTTSNVYYAPLKADKSVGTWQTGPSLPTALQYSVAGTNNGYIYIGSGFNSVDCEDATIYYSHINIDGSLGAWQTSPNVATGCLQEAMGGINNGYMYLVGGFDDTGATSTVYYTKLKNDGSLGAWQTDPNSLPQATQDAATVFSNGSMYILGGFNNTDFSSVEYVHLNSDGSLGSWQSATSLPDTIAFSAATAYNGYVYVMGGNDGNNFLDTVYFAKINNDGSLGTWQTSQFHIPVGLMSLSASSSNNYFYIIGGDDIGSVNTVYYNSVAPIPSPPVQTSSSGGSSNSAVGPPNTGYGQAKNNQSVYLFVSSILFSTLGIGALIVTRLRRTI